MHGTKIKKKTFLKLDYALHFRITPEIKTGNTPFLAVFISKCFDPKVFFPLIISKHTRMSNFEKKQTLTFIALLPATHDRQ
jgi:hypothetical protein